MKIIVSQVEGRVPITVFRLEGDLGDEELFVSEVKKAVAAGTENLLVDLTNVPYISSSGLRALHVAWMLLREDKSEAGSQRIKVGIAQGTYRSAHFKLCNPSQNAQKALSVSGYDMFLDIHKKLSDAVQSF
jgi:hypothetical protein